MKFSFRRELLVTLPSLGWLVVFFAIPCALVLTLAFRESDLRGGVTAGSWTLATVRQVADPAYLPLVWRTVWMSAATTALTVLLAIPVAWTLARARPGWRSFLLLLVVVPFLTNFLIRVFAWKSLLHPEGVIKQALVWLGIAGEDTMLLNNAGAVLLVMVHTQLPFAILPLYAAAEKFDFSLLDAARDLGAGARQAFFRVFLPGVRQGWISASLITFVCSLGQYVVPQLVGGTNDEMLGSKIVQRAFTDRNLPLASALAGALLLAVLLPVLAQAWRERKTEAAS